MKLLQAHGDTLWRSGWEMHVFKPMRVTMLGAATGIALGLCGCATTREPESDAAQATPPVSDQPVTETHFRLPEANFGHAVRHIGATYNQGIVLMSGLENERVTAYDLESATFDTVVNRIAADKECVVFNNSHYVFLAPEDYGMLNDLHLAADLDESFRDLRAGAVFGAGTPLYECLALLGYTVGVTIVADNAVAASECGEMNVPEMPLPQTLEAILKSARVPRETIRIESTPEYIFIYSLANPPGPDVLLEERPISAVEQAVLNTRVTVTLPEVLPDQEAFPSPRTARTLQEVAPSLSAQLGLPVSIERGLERLPVNQVAMTSLRLQTAMELLIRQWLVPEFGYSLTDDGILILRRPETR